MVNFMKMCSSCWFCLFVGYVFVGSYISCRYRYLTERNTVCSATANNTVPIRTNSIIAYQERRDTNTIGPTVCTRRLGYVRKHQIQNESEAASTMTGS